MPEPMSGWKRTVNCGELREEDLGKSVTLMGWVSKRRDHGGVIFVDLRDREGKTQVVFKPDVNTEMHQKAESIRSEYVIAVSGLVEMRPPGMENLKLSTGTIDVLCQDLRILNEAKTPPFQIDSAEETSEELRLKYRYLDLRTPSMLANLRLRHRAYQATRSHLYQQGFIEVETPFLMKSTPEGARDYLVPSRVSPGNFYALPQSPQTYKQLLMVAGLEKYFQIVKCFRDEDLRSDRQPEFTQIDIEMSFVEEDDVLGMAEGLTAHIFKETIGYQPPLPFPRMTYQEAIDRYGTDKPDTRFGLEIVDISDLASESEFQVFKNAVEEGGRVKGINATGQASLSRKQIDDLVAFSTNLGAKGLAWIKVTEKGLESSIVKFFPTAVKTSLAERMNAQPGDLLLFVADKPALVASTLCDLRLRLGRDLGLLDGRVWNPLWVVRFPLVEYNPTEKRYVACHHPFTAPVEEDLEKMESDPSSVRARAYDLVLNGNEIAGGSIRIYRRDVQNRMFNLLGISHDEAERKFGFLLEAFEYGAPPHGGIAFGFDRMVSLLAGVRSIREVIAFPKTNNAVSLMDDAPSGVDPTQLRELGLKIL